MRLEAARDSQAGQDCADDRRDGLQDELPRLLPIHDLPPFFRSPAGLLLVYEPRCALVYRLRSLLAASLRAQEGSSFRSLRVLRVLRRFSPSPRSPSSLF